MAAGIALEALASRGKPLRVLDPMMGSGTVLAMARAKGHRAIGVDIDPLAVLLCRVWTRPIDCEHVRAKAEEVLTRAMNLFKEIRIAAAYPKQADGETRAFIRYWFDQHARRQLNALSLAISRVRDAAVRDVLWCAFSRLIITKSVGASLAMDLAHSRPHKAYSRAPAKPFRGFMHAVDCVVKNCLHDRADNLGPATKVVRGDARALEIKNETIDLVLTSPPYLNAIDYIRCSKFSLIWMGHTIADLRKLRSESIGSEVGCQDCATANVQKIFRDLRLRPKLQTRYAAILAQYVCDMSCAISEVSRVLKKSGRAIYVVGDSTIRGTFVRNSSIVAAAAKQSGLKLVARHTRQLPSNRRYLPPPRSRVSAAGLDSRMRREVVLVFEK